MIKFTVENRTIELSEYSSDTTLNQLSEGLEEYRLENRLKTRNCKGCGKCCKDGIPVLGLDMSLISKDCIAFPEKPDMQARQKSLQELKRTNGLSELEAAVIYEYNNAEPLILAKQPDGACIFLRENLCGVYGKRPYSCGLYLCNMGERLSYIQEMIIRQGTWHAYSLLDWVSKDEIPHNPFLKAGSYDKLLVKDFEFGLENALEQLFFYF